MAFGFKKKRKETTETVQTAVDQAVTKAEETRETQERLSKDRATKEQIDAGFTELMTDPAIARASMKAAKANEEKLDKMRAAVDAMEASGGSDSDRKMSKLWELEKDIYIVPGGYPEMPNDENGIPKNNLDVYKRAIESLARSFQLKTVAESVDSGADKLNGFVVEFIGNLRNALETGHAMKANACIDMIKYILVVGYRFEDASDPEKFKERVKKKVTFIETIGKHLIEAIDYYYSLLTKYELDEAAYTENLLEFDHAIEPYNKDCPEDIKQKLDRLGFKRAMNELPPGDDARKYLGILLSAESYLTRLLMGSQRLESFSMEILRERGNIQDLVNECKKAFVAQGDEFDFYEHSRILEEIQLRNISEINKLNDFIAEEANHNRELQALIEEAAQNEKLAHAVANAAVSIQRFNRIQERNKNLTRKEKQARNAYAKEQLRLKAEELERQRLEQEEEQKLKEIIEEQEQLLEEEAPFEEEPMVIDEM